MRSRPVDTRPLVTQDKPSAPRMCPTCGKAMVVRAVRTVELDWCHACQSVFLDRGELEQLVLRPVPVCGSAPTRLPCPDCRSALHETAAGRMRLLRCSQCLGVFVSCATLLALEEQGLPLTEDQRRNQLLANRKSFTCPHCNRECPARDAHVFYNALVCGGCLEAGHAPVLADPSTSSAVALRIGADAVETVLELLVEALVD